MQEIQALVSRCQQGQLDAFGDLFNLYQDRVYDIACVILRDEVEAEDAVQDTFLSVFQKIDSYKGQSTFETWLVSVAVNHCRMRLRKKRIRQVLSLEMLTTSRLFGLGGRDEDMADVIHKRQHRQNLWTMVDSLEDRLRLPLILRYRYGLACGDIAFILSRRKSTIYQYLNEGRRLLEHRVQQQELSNQARPPVELIS